MGDNDEPFLTKVEYYQEQIKFWENLDSKLKNDRRYFYTTMIALGIMLFDGITQIVVLAQGKGG